MKISVKNACVGTFALMTSLSVFSCSISELKNQAEQENHSAQASLGHLYLNGDKAIKRIGCANDIGLKQDMKEAKKWLLKALSTRESDEKSYAYIGLTWVSIENGNNVEATKFAEQACKLATTESLTETACVLYGKLKNHN